jgi:small-conductance mechanosensitive channel
MQHLVYAILLIVAGFVVAKKAAYTIEKYSNKHFSKHHAALMKRLVFYIIVILFLISALHHLGFNLTVLLGAAGVLSVAVGFASQTAASNLISGIFLLFERPFSVDDYIEIKGFSGTVVAIDLLSTKIKTNDNRLVRIPNETMIKSEVINYYAYKTRRIDLIVDISYDDNIDKARSLLLEIAKQDNSVLTDPPPNVWVNSLADSGIELKLMTWVKTSDYSATKSALQEAIKVQFDKHKIDIPFPQITIHQAEA